MNYMKSGNRSQSKRGIVSALSILIGEIVRLRISMTQQGQLEANRGYIGVISY